MQLIELQPKWWAEKGRHGQGVSFLCPCCVKHTLHACAKCGAKWKLHMPNITETTRPLPPPAWQLLPGEKLSPCCDNPPEMDLRPGLQRLGVAFKNPLDGGAPMRLGLEVNVTNVHDLRLYDIPPGFLWLREGTTFESLTLHPSVDCSKSGHWHGFIRAGVVT